MTPPAPTMKARPSNGDRRRRADRRSWPRRRAASWRRRRRCAGRRRRRRQRGRGCDRRTRARASRGHAARLAYQVVPPSCVDDGAAGARGPAVEVADAGERVEVAGGRRGVREERRAVGRDSSVAEAPVSHEPPGPPPAPPPPARRRRRPPHRRRRFRRRRHRRWGDGVPPQPATNNKATNKARVGFMALPFVSRVARRAVVTTRPRDKVVSIWKDPQKKRPGARGSRPDSQANRSYGVRYLRSGSVVVVVVSVCEPSALSTFLVVLSCFLPVSVVCSLVFTSAPLS